ncbi:MAG: MFS transporter [Firmicutes bacterium]|nr:MFS transporter [Bacillota bacterium]
MPDSLAHPYTLEEVQSNERLSILNGNFAIIGISIVSNFAPLFVIDALHATATEVGLLNALPALMAIIATWFGAVLMAKTPSKRWFCVRSTFIGRVFYLIVAFLPFVVHGPALALVVVLAIALMNFPASFSALSWQSLIGDLIPENRRAQFFARRNRMTTIVGMLATLIPGLILQAYPVTDVHPYQVFFVLSFFMSLLEVYYLYHHNEHAEQTPDLASMTILTPRRFVQCLRRRSYLVYLVGIFVFNLGWQMAWPLFNIYQIDYAGATAIWVSAFTVANQVSQILTYSYWGRLSERFGNTFMLSVACFGMALTPVLMIVSKDLVYLVVMNLATGTFVAGISLLQFNHLLEVVPGRERTTYIAHFNIMLGAVGFVSPEVGVLLLHLLHMNAAMIASTFVRLLGTLYFLWFALRSIKAQRRFAALDGDE